MPAGLTIRPRCRVILDNDWSGDPDGLVALAHHLLSPANRVVAVTSTYLNPHFPGPHGRAADGAATAQSVVTVIGPSEPPAVVAGAEEAMDPTHQGWSAASQLIVDEARRDDPLPLYVACGGPLTNVTAALLAAPDIAERFTLAWIGGSLEAGRYEYNRDTDPVAAELVLGTAGLVVHQFPVETYRTCAVSIAELEMDLRSTGRLGAWLADHFLNPPDWVDLGEIWPLGDSPTVLVTALQPESCRTERVEVAGAATRVVWHTADQRLLTADLYAKLRRHQEGQS